MARRAANCLYVYCFICLNLDFFPTDALRVSSSKYMNSKNWEASHLSSSECSSRDYSSIYTRMSTGDDPWAVFKKAITAFMIVPLVLMGGSLSQADDELAQFAAQGNAVSVDGECFANKCGLETTRCATDQHCIKGLACLARCKGASMCSTGCFAKYGSDKLDSLLHCTVEKNDCVNVPGKENMGWSTDSIAELPSPPLKNFDISSMKGTWYKVMGLDSRYDCFDCQKNSFNKLDDNTLKMEALFRIPRPNFPGFLQKTISEELHVANGDKNNLANLQSKGQMFGLTFWENWYILDDNSSDGGPGFNPLDGMGIRSALAAGKKVPEMELVFYTGHTLQGSYKGAFLYSRSHEMTPDSIKVARGIIRRAGLDPNKFCMIRNQCFDRGPGEDGSGLALNKKQPVDPNEDKFPWFLGQRFFQVTKGLAEELSDWFKDPEYLSEWLVQQQVHMVMEKPLAVSPFASLIDE